MFYFHFFDNKLSVTFSPLLPITYPPSPISSKSQNREVSDNMGKLVKVPISTITANINITNGRHERCSQFPAASALITPARASIISRSRSYTSLRISACNSFFSRAGSVKPLITPLIALTTSAIGFISFPVNVHTDS